MWYRRPVNLWCWISETNETRKRKSKFCTYLCEWWTLSWSGSGFICINFAFLDHIVLTNVYAYSLFFMQICKDKAQADSWFLGLKSIISRSHHRRLFGTLKNQRWAQSCVNSPASYMRRKQILGITEETAKSSQVLITFLYLVIKTRSWSEEETFFLGFSQNVFISCFGVSVLFAIP